ncbi:putative kinase [Klebsiella pneumoniae subsp. rhinoscleromatis]|nr:putative kinase [Klebsiella pneumoniae subsp. rhinoscleromatis]
MNGPRRIPKTFVMILLKAAGGPAANAAWLLGLWGEEVYYIGHLQQDLYGQPHYR